MPGSSNLVQVFQVIEFVPFVFRFVEVFIAIAKVSDTFWFQVNPLCVASVHPNNYEEKHEAGVLLDHLDETAKSKFVGWEMMIKKSWKVLTGTTRKS